MARDALAPTEHEIQVKVAEYFARFAFADAFMTTSISGVWVPPAINMRMAKAGHTSGTPDMVFCFGGRTLWVELKRGKGGRVSAKQVACHARMRAAGAVVEVCHGFDAVLDVLEEFGAVPRIRAV